MDDAQLRSFLDRTLTATIATVGRNATPHSVPVWYRFDGRVFTVWTDRSRRWVKNVERNPLVSMVVAEHAPPFAAVVARGTAEVAVDEPGTDEEIRRIAERYLAADEVPAYVTQWRGLRTIVRIMPRQIRSWARGF